MQPFLLNLHLISYKLHQRFKKMKKNLLQLFVIAITFLGFNQNVDASHMAAAEITYTHLGGNQYKVFMSVYRDCNGISFTNTTLSVGYRSSCHNGGNFTVNRVGQAGVQVPASCIANSTVCTEEYKFEGTVTLPTTCHDWRFEWSLCCRPVNANVAAGNIYVYALLNNKDVTFNNSPKWNNNVTVQDFCIGKKQFFDQSTTEVDGDSVVYKMAPALSGFYTPETYINGYDSINQVPTTPAVNGIKVNQLTQSFEFTPSMAFSGSFCFKVEEWRKAMVIKIVNGVADTTYPRKLVGKIMRDMRVIFGGNCLPKTPYIAGKLNSSGVPLTDNSLGKPYYYQEVPCAATSFNVSMPEPGACGSVEPFGSDFRLYNVSTGLQYGPIVGATPYCNTSGKADSINIQMGQGMAMGNYFLIVKTGNDLNTITSACGDEIQEFEDTVLIKVSGNAAFPLSDQTVCYPTQPYPNLALDPNSTNVVWSYNGSPNGNTSPTQTADTTGTYSVTYTAYGCPGSGSVNITVNKDPIVDFPDTILRKSPFSHFYLNTEYNNGETHQWQVIVGTNPINLTGAGDSVQITVPNRGYNVTITTSAGCTYTETFWVALTDSMKFQLYATDTIICETETATIQPTTTIPNVVNYSWSLNGAGLPNLNNAQISYNQSGTYKLEVTTDDGCKGSNKITVEVHPQLGEPEVICNVSSDGNIVFSWSGVPGAEGYWVSLDDGTTWIPANGPTSHTVSDLNQQTVLVKAFDSQSACYEGAIAQSAECVKELVVPNVISPKSVDGSNDKFVIPYLELYQENYLVIFDRWGRKVFEAQPYQNDWDGGKNADGTYFYILELNDENNKVFKGNVTILK